MNMQANSQLTCFPFLRCDRVVKRGAPRCYPTTNPAIDKTFLTLKTEFALCVTLKGVSR